MKVIISLIIASLAAFYFSQNIKRKAVYYYSFAAIIAFFVVYISWGTAARLLPAWLRTIIYLFSKASLASALFIIVMYIGILPRKSIYFKRLMPIRAELSIIATILTLGHNIGYGKRYFGAFFTRDSLPVNLYYAALVSLIMIALMLPLFITSFQRVRKSMKGKIWKNLQKTAYLFYFLMWLHVVLIYVPSADKGVLDALLTLSFYHLIYSAYIFAKLKRLLHFKNSQLVAASIATFLFIGALIATYLPAQLKNLETKQQSVEQNVQLAMPATAQDASAAQQTTANGYDEKPTAQQNGQVTTQHTTTSEMTSEPSTYKDGEYYGTANGYVDDVTVRVVVKDGIISKVIIEEEQEDLEYMILAEDVVYDIIDKNSADVDTISGATTSSKAIILAVEAALATAE